MMTDSILIKRVFKAFKEERNVRGIGDLK